MYILTNSKGLRSALKYKDKWVITWQFIDRYTYLAFDILLPAHYIPLFT